MKPLDTCELMANATIWQHCVQIYSDMHEIPQLFWFVSKGIAMAMLSALAVVFVVLVIATFPISFPLIGWWNRRVARKQWAAQQKIRKWNRVSL